MNIEPPKHPEQPLPTAPAGEPSMLPAAAGQHLHDTGLEPSPREKRGRGLLATLSTILLFALAPAIAVLIAAFGFQSYQVDGESMQMTLQNRDRLIVDKIPRTWARITHHAYVPQRGNIIVFNESGLFDANGLAEKQLIKRVIGLPGERVVLNNGKYTVYNAAHPNGFNPDTTSGYIITAPTTPGQGDWTLKSNQIFVSGDNRTNSEDSRYFGPVNVNQIVGHLVLRLLPLNTAERF